ncbi:MAG: FkbM family methyltransferase [Erythrobacter sp.]|jgi:FkbM family methyltransferase|nr:FkbM family methyltransferase [Erythrobacter sp.]
MNILGKALRHASDLAKKPVSGGQNSANRHGRNLGHDAKKNLPGFKFGTVMDVGANVGQSALTFLKEYNAREVICFEPVRNNFAELEARFANDPRVTCVQSALGSEEGSAVMTVEGPGSRILADLSDNGSLTQGVAVTTLDKFCADAGITTIDFLKIDAEGSEVEVIEGAGEFLKSGNVGLLQVEAGISSTGPHVPLEEIWEKLATYDFKPFGIYNQALQWPTGEPFLRRVDAVFISPALVARYARR